MSALPIETPFLAILAFSFAIGAAHLALRFLPKVDTLLPDNGEPRHLAIDGMRGLLATGVFVHHLAVSSQFLVNGRWEVPPSQLYSHLGKTSAFCFSW
ncbi:MAG: hypothetical protein EKK46_10310 [Rhodocyclaceae bacterium]|nr:MAG: hypothetical protein EKK46_10310 [Rhodocyclaceae bacterium]